MNSARKTSPSAGHREKETAPLSLDYGHLSRLCLKHWKWLAGGVVVGVLAGFIWAAFQTPIYAAMATLNVPTKSASSPSGADNVLPDVTTGDMIKTYEQLLQTKDLPARVVKSQHLNENPDFLPAGVTPPVSEDAATSMLAGDVAVHIRPFTRLIDITVEHRSPEMALLLANQLAQESVLQQFDQNSESANERTQRDQQEADRLRKQVLESDRALEEYQTSHNMGGSLEVPEDASDTQLKDLNQQYINAQAQVTLLEERYLPQHPKLIQAQAMVDQLRKELDKAQAEAALSSSKNIEYDTLKSEADSNRTALDNVLKDLRQIESAPNMKIPDVYVVGEAQPLGLVRPNRTKAVAIGGFAGLLCGLAFIMGVYFLDSSIRSVSQAESTLNLPVIAAIPILTHSDGRSTLPAYSDPQSFVAESFRGLRASLILHDRENPLKTILVASAIPGEGKSFCGANLAVAFAQAGLKTLLIDADLRLPTLHSYFNIAPGGEAGGFVEVLTGRSILSAAVVSTQIPTLELLLTAVPADSPAELLSGIRLPLLLDEAAQNYDRVVIDSAPLNAVSDTMLIMQKADAILLVIRAAQTPSSECKSALQKIYSSKMKPLGLILNYLAPHTLKSYAYGYSYGQKPKDKNAR
ncbi:MAG: polysaccharide biosynthesis tyrosine autokinase [Methylacidiphilales bacterium]|nr:polysaccharide biosynthesis tyrosine autokinase [Candidatus Methylacidiphilales bacterium]